MFFFALLTPIIGVLYLACQLRKHHQYGWQHYACLTSLIVLISILFLVGSDKVQSFDVAGNSVQLVDQKLNEVKALTEQNKLLAKQTVELINKATSGAIVVEGYDEKGTLQGEANLLRVAGYSNTEIEQIIGTTNFIH